MYRSLYGLGMEDAPCEHLLPLYYPAFYAMLTEWAMRYWLAVWTTQIVTTTVSKKNTTD